MAWAIRRRAGGAAMTPGCGPLAAGGCCCWCSGIQFSQMVDFMVLMPLGTGSGAFDITPTQLGFFVSIYAVAASLAGFFSASSSTASIADAMLALYACFAATWRHAPSLRATQRCSPRARRRARSAGWSPRIFSPSSRTWSRKAGAAGPLARSCRPFRSPRSWACRSACTSRCISPGARPTCSSPRFVRRSCSRRGS